MRSNSHTRTMVLGFLVSLPGLAACRTDASPGQYQTIHASVEPLRSAFNADSAKVRAIFLASPT